MSTSNSKKSKIPRAFIITLAIIFVIEGIIVHFDNYFFESFENPYLSKLKVSLSRLPVHFDILLFGDSYLQTSVVPEIITSKTGLTCFNYSSTQRHTIIYSYFLLKNILKANKNPPKYIFIEYHHPSWTLTKDEIQEGYLTNLYDFRNHVGEFYDEFGLAESIKMFIPSLKHQEATKKVSLGDRFREIKLRQFYHNFVMVKFIRLHGAYILFGDPVDLNKEPFEDECIKDLHPSPIFQKYFEKLLKLAQDNNIKTYYVMIAEPHKWQKRTQRCGHFQPFLDYLNQVGKTYPNLRVINSQTAIDKDEYFYNLFHLNLKGTKILSRYISDVIKEDLIRPK